MGPNAAWLAHAVIAFNLARAVGALAGRKHTRAPVGDSALPGRSTCPARIAASGGRAMTLHLPRNWVWAGQWHQVFGGATEPPIARAA